MSRLQLLELRSSPALTQLRRVDELLNDIESRLESKEAKPKGELVDAQQGKKPKKTKLDAATRTHLTFDAPRSATENRELSDRKAQSKKGYKETSVLGQETIVSDQEVKYSQLLVEIEASNKAREEEATRNRRFQEELLKIATSQLKELKEIRETLRNS